MILRGFGGWTVVIVLALFVVESLLAPFAHLGFS